MNTDIVPIIGAGVSSEKLDIREIDIEDLLIEIFQDQGNIGEEFQPAIIEALDFLFPGGSGRAQKYLIVTFARKGTRPDWMPGAKPYWEPWGYIFNERPRNYVRGVDPSEVVIPVEEVSDTKAANAWFCRIRLINHPDLIRLCRLNYLDWVNTLQILVKGFSDEPPCEKFSSQLGWVHTVRNRFKVTGPSAPVSPWETNRTSKSVRRG